MIALAATGDALQQAAVGQRLVVGDDHLGKRVLTRGEGDHVTALDECCELGIRQHHRGTGLGNGELLARDLLTRFAEDVGVLERDVGEDLDRRPQHVRRVVPAAEPRLDDRDVDARGGELRERRGGQELELGRPQTLGGSANALDCRLEVGLLTANANALAPAADVRREVCADDQPLPGEHLLDRARDGGLPVRPDDVDRRVRELGIAELREERLDPVEPEAVLRPRAQRLDQLNC